MRRFIASHAAILTLATGLVVCGLNSTAAFANDGAISSATTSRAGLSVDWFTQVEVGAYGKIVDLTLTVDENLSTTLFYIRYAGQSEIVSQHDTNAFGEPYGVAGAERAANLRKEIIAAELKARGLEKNEITIDKVVLPASTIYVCNSHGLVSALDADTGRIKWSTKIGNRKYPTIGIGASAGFIKMLKADDDPKSQDKVAVYHPGHVAVINGSSIYCLNAENGKKLWSKRARVAPCASPAVSNDYIFVPVISGRLEAFPIETKGVGVESFVATGKATSRPLLTDDTVSWATDKGSYTVAPIPDKGLALRSIRYRLSADNAIVCSGNSKTYKTADGKTKTFMFVSSLDGFLYSIDERRGTLQWEFSTGQRVTQSPITVGNFVYVITSEDDLFKIDAHNGRVAPGWEDPLPGVTKYVGASADKLFLLDKHGQLFVVNQNSGARLGSVPSAPLSLVLSNQKSDRIYVGTEGGYIQCLRESGSRFPYFHANSVEGQAAKPAPVNKTKPDADDPFATDDGSDPFGKGADDDPFATGKKKAAADDDPFATGKKKTATDDDPFATGKDKSKAADDDDPFATGKNKSKSDDDDDPFGGN